MSPTRYVSTVTSRRTAPGRDAGAPSDRVAGNTETELDRLFSGTVALFHRLGSMAEELHRESRISAGMRGVLRQLHREGPLTIPHMARSRPVTRQHIQSLVQALLDLGLVERIENPTHRRSFLVGLTAGGRSVVGEMGARERQALEQLASDLRPEEVRQATRVLERVRRYFESEHWQTTLQGRR